VTVTIHRPLTILTVSAKMTKLIKIDKY